MMTLSCTVVAFAKESSCKLYAIEITPLQILREVTDLIKNWHFLADLKILIHHTLFQYFTGLLYNSQIYVLNLLRQG